MTDHTFTTQGFADDKYFVFNGKVEKPCPKCQKPVERDFMSDGNTITLFPYSGWHSGKGIVDGRGFAKLLKQLK